MLGDLSQIIFEYSVWGWGGGGGDLFHAHDTLWWIAL